MARTKEHAYDLAVHREDRPARSRTNRRAKPAAPAKPSRPTEYAKLEALIGLPYRNELPKRLGEIDPLEIVKILEPLGRMETMARSVADHYRQEYDEKKRGSRGWHRRRVRDAFKRFEVAVEEFYRSSTTAAISPETYPVLRLMRELRDYLAGKDAAKLPLGGDDLVAWIIQRRSGPSTAYVTNPPNPVTATDEARRLLRARFGMGRVQQDWWLRARL